jgi:DNA-binding cell septation regulator SpoVG
MSRIEVHSYRPARSLDVAAGLLGYARVQVGDLVVDSVAIRRARDGRHLISLPSRRDRGGVEHSVVAPVSSAVGRELEALVLADLRRQGVLQ